MFGYAQEEMLGHPLSRIIPERFRKAHQQGILRAAAATPSLQYQVTGGGRTRRVKKGWNRISHRNSAWHPGKTRIGPIFTGDHSRYHRAETVGRYDQCLVQWDGLRDRRGIFPCTCPSTGCRLGSSNAFVTSLVPGSQTKFAHLAGWEKTAWGETFEYESRPYPMWSGIT